MNIWTYVRKFDSTAPEKHIELLVKEAKRFIYKNKTTKILDIGGGYLDRTKLLKDLGLVTVLDVKRGSNIDIVGDILNLPIKKSCYDVVTLFTVLEHVEDPKKAFMEIARVLKPNGLLLLTTVQYWHNHDCPGDYFRFTNEGLQYLASQAGLKTHKIWSLGGPIMVVFHAVELNLPSFWRKLFFLLTPIFSWLDKKVGYQNNNGTVLDSVGWAMVAQKGK